MQYPELYAVNNRVEGIFIIIPNPAGACIISIVYIYWTYCLKNIQFLFDPFKQLDDFLTKKHGGLGIGLTLVNHYAQIHGGKIEVESEENKGSVVIVKIPVDTKQNDVIIQSHN